MENCLGLSHFQHVLIHLELWRLDNQHKPHEHVPRLQEREMCTMLLHSQITTRLNQQFWSTKHHVYLTQTESNLYVKETALKAYMFLIIACNHSEKHPNNAYNHPKKYIFKRQF